MAYRMGNVSWESTERETEVLTEGCSLSYSSTHFILLCVAYCFLEHNYIERTSNKK